MSKGEGRQKDGKTVRKAGIK